MKKFWYWVTTNETLKTVKDRLKSHTVWGGIIAQICIIVTLINPTASDSLKTIFTCLLEIVTLVGFINNPSDRGEL